MLITPMTPNVIARPIAIKHQHRAQAQTEEERLDSAIEATATVDLTHRVRAASLTAGVGLDEPAVWRICRAGWRAGSGPPARSRPASVATACQRASGSRPSSAASARPVSISCLHGRVRFDAAAPAAARWSRRRASAAFPDRREPHRASPLERSKRATAVLSTRSEPVVRADLG